MLEGIYPLLERLELGLALLYPAQSLKKKVMRFQDEANL